MNSHIVGIGGYSTGLSLFTLKKIPRGTLVCTYAPTATIWEGKRNGDYVLETSFNNKVISVHGKENLFELALGIYCNDGSFPFSLARAWFSNFISHRIYSEFCKCRDSTWLKTVGDVSAGEERLMCYSKDGSYWAAILSQITAASNSCGPSLQDAECCIRLLQVQYPIHLLLVLNSFMIF